MPPREPDATPKAPARILLCMGPCHGDFYLPMDLNETIACPNDSSHPVAVYSTPTLHAGRTDDLSDELVESAIRGLAQVDAGNLLTFKEVFDADS